MLARFYIIGHYARMNEQIKTAVVELFKNYDKNMHLDKLEGDIASKLEDNYQALRRKGIIESAALKKTLSDLNKIINNAEQLSGGDKQKRLEGIAKGLGLSPLGHSMALAYTITWLLAGCGIVAAIAFWLVRRDLPGAISAFTPFAAFASAAIIFLQLTRYHAGRRSAPNAKAALLALFAGAAVAFALVALAAVLS